MKSISIRFYEELNDFLPPEKQKIRFEHKFKDRTSVKDLIESLGVPHTEIDMILVNGKSVDFKYLIEDGDDISVYPVFESFDISGVQHLRPKPLRNPKFILDVHLGTLAKYMRMLGFDVLYRNDYNDEEIVDISLKYKRTILTKDRGILKQTKVTHGYYVRNIVPKKQVKEVVQRFEVENYLLPFTRCLECNSLLSKIEKEKIIDRLPAKVKDYHVEFFICSQCDKIFWKGTHFDDMERLIEFVKTD